MLWCTKGWNITSKNFSGTNFVVAVKYLKNVYIHTHTRQKGGGMGTNASFLPIKVLSVVFFSTCRYFLYSGKKLHVNTCQSLK